MIILTVFAFLAGVVTILSPCILPILPIILTSTIGGGEKGWTRPIGVIVGFIASFTFFTLFLTSIVRVFGISADSLRLFSVVVILLFGISLLIPFIQAKIEILFARLSRFVPQRQVKPGFIPGFMIGISLGLLWTPCVGPILASVISLALTGTVTFDAFIITLSYATGTAIPMFLIMLGGQKLLKKIPWLLNNTSKIQKAFGLIMILTALGIFLNFDRKFQSYILDKFPNYGANLTKVEDNPLVRDQLTDMNNQGTKAPEIIPGGNWFNSEPLKLSDLKGKVVLIDFWTYTCINCIRTLPYIQRWHQSYQNQGLVIIGVHTPEFEFEKTPENLQRAITDFGLTYPIVQDNDYQTWQAYSNRYWPAKYLIDKNGKIVYTHFGEGKYDETEAMIQKLLKESGSVVDQEIDNPTYSVETRTPELYLGYGRISDFASPERVREDKLAAYTSPPNLGNNQVAYAGDWIVMAEYASPQKGAKLYLNFDAKEVFLVTRSNGSPAKIKVYLDGLLQYFGEDNLDGTVTVTKDSLYKLIKLPTPGKHNLRLEFEDANTELYAFTFG